MQGPGGLMHERDRATDLLVCVGKRRPIRLLLEMRERGTAEVSGANRRGCRAVRGRGLDGCGFALRDTRTEPMPGAFGLRRSLYIPTSYSKPLAPLPVGGQHQIIDRMDCHSVAWLRWLRVVRCAWRPAPGA